MSGPDDLMPGEEPMDADEMLAMDWALGALEAPARAAAEARRQADPAFARLCDEWAARLAPLADEIAPVAPSPGLWDRIEAEIAPVSAPAVVERPTLPAAERPTPWWNSLGLWRGATAALAAVSLALLVTRPQLAPVAPPVAMQPAPATLLAATLSSEGGAPLATASLDPSRRAVLVSPVSAEDLDGRVPELWLIPADGTPRSLGVINLGGVQQVEIPPTLLKLVADGAVLAVSLEPTGGSPTGLPTGPVVATGKLSTI